VTPRARITEEPTGLRVEIPARRSPRLALYAVFLLGFWALGEAAVVHALLAGPASGGDALAAAICLVPWTALGAAILAGCLWVAAGRAVVIATDRELTIRCGALGLGTTRAYDMAHVRALRLGPPWIFQPRPALGFTVWLTPGAGPIALDYGSRTIRFGNGLDEPDARRVVERLAERFHIPTNPAA
jgi:hypothetical protein